VNSTLASTNRFEWLLVKEIMDTNDTTIDSHSSDCVHNGRRSKKSELSTPEVCLIPINKPLSPKTNMKPKGGKKFFIRLARNKSWSDDHGHS
jgi:hypothetical protein